MTPSGYGIELVVQDMAVDPSTEGVSEVVS